MLRAGRRRVQLGPVVVVGTVVLSALVVVAARAGAVGTAGAAGVVLDVGVGLALGAAGLAGPGALAQRVLVWSVGAAWLTASVLPGPTLHQALLVAALALFPVGRPGTPRQLWVLLAVVPVTFGVGAQVLAGAALVGAGVVGSTVRRPAAVARWFPAGAGSAVGGVLLVVGTADALRPGSLHPGAVLVAYELVLIGVAAGHVLAMRAVAREPARRLRGVVSAHRAQSFRGRQQAMEAMLAESLHDPGLRLLVSPPGGGPLLDWSGAAPPVTGAGRWRVLLRAGTPVAALATASPFAGDPVVGRALDEAVGLVAHSLQLAEEREHRLGELRAARTRLVEAARREREQLAGRLRERVLPQLAGAVEALGRVDAGSGRPEVATARAELVRARDDIGALLRGSAPAAFGGGRLVDALGGLSRSAPLPVLLEVRGDVSADAEVEAACYHVCAEAVANAVKHAEAADVRIRLVTDGTTLAVSVVDGGRGGADPEGSGLTGLRDRVLALGGRWRVVSPAGAGTLVSASLPTDPSRGRSDD